MNRFGIITTLIFCFVSSAGISLADTIYIPADGKGTEFTFPLPPSNPIAPAEPEIDEIQFWYVSRGKVSTGLEVELSGAIGLKGTLEAREITGSPASALKISKGWYKVETDKAIDTVVAQALPFRSAFERDCPVMSESAMQGDLAYYGWPDDPENYYRSKVCQICTKEAAEKRQSARRIGYQSMNPYPKCAPYDDRDIKDELDYYDWPETQEYISLVCDMLWADEHFPTRYERCGRPLSPIDDNKDGSVTSNGIIHKNTCSGSRSLKYLVRLKVSLAGVGQSEREAGYEVKVKFTENAWKGGMQSAIKPVSDGRFYPKPIVMMVTVGGDQNIDVYSFAGSRPRRIKRLTALPSDNFPRYGKMYARAAAGSLLKGGQAVFEMNNGKDAYSVCFELRRVRQNKNGFR